MAAPPPNAVLDRDAAATLYDQLADRLEQLVNNGTLRPGDRLPSLRKACRQYNVSLATAMEAYKTLEARRVVEARPQSGFYVLSQAVTALPEPEPTRTERRPVRLSTRQLTANIHAEAVGDTFIKLGAAVPDTSMLPTRALGRIAARISRERASDVNQYSLQGSCPELRRALALRLTDTGLSVAPDKLVLTAGATEAIALALLTTTQPGDVVAVESPTFFLTLCMIQQMGRRVIEVGTSPNAGIDLDDLERVIKQHGVKAVYVVANFSNPLGHLMPDDHKRRLAKMAAKHKVAVIEDDVYGELPFNDVRPRAVSAFDDAGWVIYCGSLSKSLSPGLRVGYSYPGRWTTEAQEVYALSPPTVNAMGQLVAAEYLAGGAYDRHLRRLRRSYRDNVTRMTCAVAAHFPEGTRISKPAGGYMLWIEMPAGIDAIELRRRALRRHISIAVGPVFAATDRFTNCIRLSAALPWGDRVEQAVATLGRLARGLL